LAGWVAQHSLDGEQTAAEPFSACWDSGVLSSGVVSHEGVVVLSQNVVALDGWLRRSDLNNHGFRIAFKFEGIGLVFLVVNSVIIDQFFGVLFLILCVSVLVLHLPVSCREIWAEIRCLP
jgi:hypothetical protein